MKKILRHSRKAFTLVEVMIVVAIIWILMGIGIMPYTEYMRMATLSNTVDTVAQEWILAHKEVRNGIEYSPGKHASILLHFSKDSNKIEKYLVEWTGQTLNAITNLRPSSNLKLKKTIHLDSKVELLSLTGGTQASPWAIKKINNSGVADNLYYFIEAPYGTGTFYSNLPASNPTNKIDTLSKNIVIWYEWSNTLISSQAREIMLRPYLQ